MRTVLLFFLLIFSLTSFSQEMRLVLPTGHTYVESAVFSPDGTRILTAGFDRTAKLWNAETGALLATLEGHKMYQGKVSFSPDGSMIATSGDGGVRVFNPQTGKLKYSVNARDFDFSPDSRQFVVYHFNDSVKVIDAFSGNVAHVLEFIEGKDYQTIAFSDDGRSVVATGGDSTSVMWSLQDQKISRVFRGHAAEVNNTIISPNGKLLLSLSDDSTGKIWEVPTGRLLHNLEKHKENPTHGLFSPDSKSVITLDNSSALLWNVETGKEVDSFRPDVRISTDAVFSKDGKYIWTIGDQNVAYKLDAITGKVVTTYKGHSSYLLTVRLSPDEKKLVTASSDHTAKVFEVATGDELTTLEGSAFNISNTGFSVDGKLMVTTTSHGVKVWDTENLRLLRSLKDEWTFSKNPLFSNDGSAMITVFNDSVRRVSVWNVKDWTLRAVLVHDTTIEKSVLSPSSNYVLTVQSDSMMYAWDVNAAERVWEWPKADIGNGRVFSTTHERVVVLKNGKAFIISISDGEILHEFGNESLQILTAEFSPDGTRLLAACTEKKAIIWDALTGKFLTELRGHSGITRTAIFSPDGKFVATTDIVRSWISGDETLLHIWRLDNGTALPPLKFKSGREFKQISFSPDSKKIMAATGFPLDNIEDITWWDVQSGKLISSVKPPGGFRVTGIHPKDQSLVGINFSELALFDEKDASKKLSWIYIDTSDYIAILPSRHYMASPGAAKKLHYVTEKLDVVSFEQLDIRFNRPDLVLESLGSHDTAKIQSFHKAYKKRLQKLQVDTAAFSWELVLPEADIANRKELTYIQTKDKITLRIIGRSARSPLKTMNVWVNETPLFGSKGIILKNVTDIDTTIDVHLSHGKNVIEMSVTSAEGNESYRLPLQVKFSPAFKKPEEIHFIGIGINKFHEPGHDLNWSVKDIRDLATALKKKYGSSISIDTLFDHDVTASNVTSLKSKLLKTSIHDKVIVAYSGHGLLSDDFDYYLSTYNVDFTHPEKDGLPYEALEGLLDSIPARQKLMLIDACHSGEVDKEEMEKYVMIEKTLEDSGTKSGRKPIPADGKLGMKNSFELMQELFVNVGRSTGATVISAAAGTQFAQEKGDLQNGVFTYSILEYMKAHPTATVSELRQYVNKRVSELTQGMQVPTTRSETRAVDWRVW